MTLNEALKKLRYEGPRLPVTGICSNLSLEHEDEVKPIFYRWPEHSGDPTFPVAHPSLTPKDAYLHLANLWDRSTEYGQARWRLLDWLIEETSK